jgi:hypothetical protein
MSDLEIIDEIIIILINWFNSLLSIPNLNKYLSNYLMNNYCSSTFMLVWMHPFFIFNATKTMHLTIQWASTM